MTDGAGPRAQGARAAGTFRRVAAVLEVDARLLAMFAVPAAIAVGFEFATGGFFLTARNLFNLSLQTSVVAIMATGMVLVIVSRHIDLSVGSLMGLAGMFAAVFQVWVFPVGAGYNWIVTLLICIAFGALLGAFQGYWIAYRALPSFIVTLAGLLAWRGASWLISGGVTISPMDETFQKVGGGLEGTIGETWSRMVGDLIKRLKSEGIGIFLISHDIHDVFDLSDRITVLNGGKVVDTVRTEEVTKDQVLGMIILGKRIEEETAEDLASLH